MRNALRVLKAAGEAFALEPMEGRQLLAADLGVSWDDGSFRIPGVIVPGDQFGTSAGDFTAPIRISNMGPGAANGSVRLKVYLSADTTLNPGQDVLLGSIPSQPVSLASLFGSSAEFTPTFAIPPRAAAGDYYLIVQMVPGASIGDTNASNDVAVSQHTVRVEHEFGDFVLRTGVSTMLRDADGTLVTFTQTGGGSGDVTGGSSGFGVTLTGSGDLTQVHITASGGDGHYTLSSVAINGAVGVFSAPQSRLTGPLTTTTGFGAMTFGDVTGPMTITVPASSRSPSFTFGNVSEVSIDSAVGITSINAQSWIDRDGTADSIRAPWLDTLTVAGNFYPSIFLSGTSDPLEPQTGTLGTVNIGGVVKQGAWSVAGKANTINIYASTVEWSATFLYGLGTLTTGGSLRGVVTGAGFGGIQSGKDILRGMILAGTYLGADGVLGGDGANADTFGPGSIEMIQAARNVAGNFIAAGLDPVDGVFNNGNDQILGGWDSYISRISVGHIAGAQSRFLSNAYTNEGYEGDGVPVDITIGGQSIDWHNDPRFALHTVGPSGTVMSATVADLGGSSVATIQLHLSTGGLIDMDSIMDGAIQVTGPGGFSGLGLLMTKSWDGNVNDGSAAYGTFTVRLNNVGDPLASGMYTVSFVDDVVSDTRGNFAPAVGIGTFMV